jgi:hypothetical protein
MSKWNYQLFENFKDAAAKLHLTVTPGWSYYKLNVPKGFNAYCWTPLNKMNQLLNYYPHNPDRMLDHIRNNQDDFHLEFDYLHDNNAMGMFASYFKGDYSVDKIKSALELMLDKHAFDQHMIIYLLSKDYENDQGE